MTTCAAGLPSWRHAPTNSPIHLPPELGMSTRILQLSAMPQSRATAVLTSSPSSGKGTCRWWLPRWTGFAGTSWTWDGCRRSSRAECPAFPQSPRSALPCIRWPTQKMPPVWAWSWSISRSTQSDSPSAPAPPRRQTVASEFSARC